MIKGKWEDKIYDTRKFIRELEKVQQSYYKNLRKKLIKDGFDESEKIDDHLWDFIFNDNTGREFEEYLMDHGQINSEED